MNVHLGKVWTIQVRTEGHPAHDPDYVNWMTRQWRRFFNEGFGPGTTVSVKVKIEAGDTQDGRPPDQLVILPSLTDASV
jgi:hypothetical protein